jgi:hypothetical protein
LLGNDNVLAFGARTCFWHVTDVAERFRPPS